MIYQSPRNPNSHLTVKERTQRSFPTAQLFDWHLIKGKVLDFGSGLGTDVNFLRERGYDVTGYDPYYKPEYPQEQFDTIICIYVLNVLLPEEQVHVLMAISELLKPTGNAYFAVRRDIRQNGFRTHLKHNCKVYQSRVVLPYKSLFKNDYCELYEYQHINQVVIGKHIDCQGCCPAPNSKLLTESATAYAILESVPVSLGHAIILPKQHVTSYFELPQKIKTACWIVTDRSKFLIERKFQPAGYNVWISVGETAGQTSSHTQIHLIPRYA